MSANSSSTLHAIRDAGQLTCNLCGGGAELHLRGFPTVVRCRQCGLLSLAEFPDRQVREAGYQESYYREEDGERFFAPFEWALGALKKLRMRAIVRRVRGPGSILDVGCGRGDLIELFRKAGWRVLGTQISRTAAEAARRRRGVDVVVGELPELTLPESRFDVITFFHVLEHLDRPEAYLRRAHDLLADDGLLVVEVPDCDGPGFRLLGLKSLCLDYPHHLVFFTPRSLEGLLERTGFRVEALSRFSVEYSPYTTLQNLINVLPGSPNRLYRAFMRNAEGATFRKSPWTIIHAILAVVLAAPAFLASLSSLILPTGNTMRFYCRKR